MFKKLSPKSDSNHEYTCTVRFLDDSDPLQIKFQKQHSGQWLLDKVCTELNLIEQDYFGLRYVDAERQRELSWRRHWIDPLKTVYRQLKNVVQMVVCFRVKFYPDDPLKLQEEVTRYSLFLQLRRDLHHGRLLCSGNDANLLAAYIIQSEVGDYHEDDCKLGYVSKFKMLPRQTTTDEEKIMEVHKTLSGLVPSEAEENFLKKACCLDTYGVDPHQVQDSKGVSMYLGVTHLGVVTFHSNKRNNLYRWEDIVKLGFDSKMFIINTEEGDKKLQVGYRCPTYGACKHLWKCAVEQQAFFTLDKSSEAKKFISGGGLFRRSSKYRFSGRCQSEVYTYSAAVKRDSIDFTRSPSSTLQRRFSEKRPERPKIQITAPDSQSLEECTDMVIANMNAENIENSQQAEPVEQTMNASQNIQTELEPTEDDDNKDSIDETGSATVDNVSDSVGNHIGESAEAVGDGIEVEVVLPDEVTANSTSTDVVEDSPGPAGDVIVKTEDPPADEVLDEQSKIVEVKAEPSSGGLSVISLFLCMFLFAVVMVVLMDDRIDMPFLQDVRKISIVSDLRYLYYNPVREYLGNKIQSFIKGA